MELQAEVEEVLPTEPEAGADRHHHDQ